MSVVALVDAINAWDVEESQLARRKAGSDGVRRFAMDLASAHPQKVADRSVPATDADADALLRPLLAAQRETMERLAAVPAGPAFDRAFVGAQIERHERVLATVRGLASSVGSRDLDAVLQRTVAQVEQHLREARALQQRLP
ncbi:MAG: DUF4142 domain-containing protein [Gemmatirosa sp.]|nr:DUF4142 domain-containing protein [Gemmatirosa sp.]